jgi:hypothetical protein
MAPRASRRRPRRGQRALRLHRQIHGRCVRDRRADKARRQADTAGWLFRVPCSADHRAIGNRWIEVDFGCGYHSGTITTVLQQIRSGQVILAPAAAIPGRQGGGTGIVELNSPTGTRRLCSPLRVPNYGKIALDGRFAVEESNLNENVFLEHCGSHSRMMIGRRLFSVNSRAVLMSVGPASNLCASRVS